MSVCGGLIVTTDESLLPSRVKSEGLWGGMSMGHCWIFLTASEKKKQLTAWRRPLYWLTPTVASFSMFFVSRPQNREFQLNVIFVFSGNVVQYLWSVLSFPCIGKKHTKKTVSQHPLSFWANTGEYDILRSPGALCSADFRQTRCLHLLWGGGRWRVLLAVLACWQYSPLGSIRLLTVLFGRWGRCICTTYPGRKNKPCSEQSDPYHFLSGDRKELL